MANMRKVFRDYETVTLTLSAPGKKKFTIVDPADIDNTVAMYAAMNGILPKGVAVDKKSVIERYTMSAEDFKKAATLVEPLAKDEPVTETEGGNKA